MTPPAYVYIMASQRNGTIYTGCAMDVAKRAWEHRTGVVEGFTKRHGCHLLVWYEAHETLWAARVRERQIKEWKRAWRVNLIEDANPLWKDLSGLLVPL